jgi:hypothetical protein
MCYLPRISGAGGGLTGLHPGSILTARVPLAPSYPNPIAFRLACPIRLGSHAVHAERAILLLCCVAQHEKGNIFREIVIEGRHAMTPPDQQKPRRGGATQGTPLTAWLPVLAAMAIMIIGCLSTLLVLQLDEFRPKVGDIVAFRPGSQDGDLWQVAIRATLVSSAASPSTECLLDPNVMAEKGGSLVVEGLQATPAPMYRIHWAGSVTAKTAGDCGESANLLVSRTDLQRLANAAGGFGIGEKGIIR